jgi:hypothetical protein
LPMWFRQDQGEQCEKQKFPIIKEAPVAYCHPGLEGTAFKTSSL